MLKSSSMRERSHEEEDLEEDIEAQMLRDLAQNLHQSSTGSSHPAPRKPVFHPESKSDQLVKLTSLQHRKKG